TAHLATTDLQRGERIDQSNDRRGRRRVGDRLYRLDDDRRASAPTVAAPAACSHRGPMMNAHAVTAISGGAGVAFGGSGHRLIEPGVIAFAGDEIVYVGRNYPGTPANIIDASGMLVIPGQVSAHAHVSAQEGSRLLIDGGRRDFFRSGFLNYVPTKSGEGAPF